ncbi:MAG: hypothetical protein AAGC77_09695 [Pseudomonadota bacterium]
MLKRDALLEASWIGFWNVLIWLYPLMLLWPYWPFSKRMKMESGFLTVGMQKYDLTEISRFGISKENFKPGADEYIVDFGYGRKRMELKVRNPHNYAFDIAEFLNLVHQTLVEHSSLRLNATDQTETKLEAFYIDDTRPASF